MAKLFEFEGKKILKDAGIIVPDGNVISSVEEARKAVEDMPFPLVVKAQAWVTGRASLGGIKFAEDEKDLIDSVDRILGMDLKGFKVNKVLIETKLSIEKEYFAGIIIDDSTRKAMMVVSAIGGSGIEEIAKNNPESVIKFPLNIEDPLFGFEARNQLRKIGVTGKDQVKFGEMLSRLWNAFRSVDARSLEVNPVVKTQDGKWMAADCHITIDDYAVFRHPELGIEIAREFDRPATELEKIAYRVEQDDYRGTFYFIQLATDFGANEGVIGFHGSGGGGSMMSMDALLNQNFKLANFCDTSGNPSASKVYRAARIILAQGPVDGYFLSGSGVASQEQFHSARGLVKAFREVWLDKPAVIRLGGNGEDKAVKIIEMGTSDLPAPVEGYRKHDSPEYCAGRMKALLKEKINQTDKPLPGAFKADYEFKTPTGKISFDYEKCRSGASEIIVNSCKPGILKLEKGLPVLAVSREEAARNKCIECLACEIECLFAGFDAVRIDLPIDGFEQWQISQAKNN